jgi:hypothetical protein
MELTSPVFQNRNWIPKRYTALGENISPPLRWSGEPRSCKGFALLCEDLDAPATPEHAGHFVHWIAYHLSPSVSALPEGILSKERLDLPIAIDQGLNAFGQPGYGGPLPPHGSGIHHYRFKLYALKAPLGLPPGAGIDAFHEAIKDHVLETAELTGIYQN